MREQAIQPRRPQGIGIFDVNFETGRQYWSPEFRAMLGIALDEEPDFHRLLQQVHPDDRRALAERAVEAFRPDCPERRSSEYRIVRSDCVPQWVHVETRVFFGSDEGRDVIRVAGVVIAIDGPAMSC